MVSETFRTLARRYRAGPAGTPGTPRLEATGSEAAAQETEAAQGLADYGTPGTRGTPEISCVAPGAADEVAGAVERYESPPLPERGTMERARWDAEHAQTVRGAVMGQP